MPFTAVARANILQNIVQFNAGSAATPGVSFVTQPSTGLFLSGANVGVTIGGVEKANVSSSGFSVNGTVSASTFVGNGSQLTGLATPMTISNVQITSNTWTVLDDLAVSTDGGYCLVNGDGFGPGSLVSAGSDFASSTSFVSSAQLKAQLPAKTSGSYTVTVTRGDTVTASLPFGITYSSFPAWSTSTDLGSVMQNTSFTRVLAAPSDSTVIYANTSALPPQTTLTSNGTLSGNITSITDDTTYTFGVKATDLEFQDVPRTFSLQYFLAFIARKLTASDKAASDTFGTSVEMSADGNYMIVAAYGADPGGLTQAGAAYVYRRSGTTWVEEAKLTANDKVASDYFGTSVTISSDGTRVCIGANNVSPGGILSTGAAYVFSRSGTTWTQEARILASDKAAYDVFGTSVSISSEGTRVIVGARQSDPGGTPNAGAAYVFIRSGTTWTEEAKIFASDKVASDNFGHSVAMSSDGTRVIVGAINADPGGLENAGAAYVFIRSGTTWTQEAKIIASDKAAYDSFGTSVALTSDGSRVCIGAHYATVGGLSVAGAAYIFSRSGTTWTEEFKLTASDKAASDYFGWSVSIAADGSRVIVGAFFSDPGGTTNAGAAYVFTRSGTTWTQEAKLFASDKAVSDRFGWSVSMNSGGTRVGIGAYDASPGGITNAGAAYICGYSNGAWVSY